MSVPKDLTEEAIDEWIQSEIDELNITREISGNLTMSPSTFKNILFRFYLKGSSTRMKIQQAERPHYHVID